MPALLLCLLALASQLLAGGVAAAQSTCGVRVSHEDGKPAVGARVHVVYARAFAAWDAARMPTIRSQVCDDEGRVELELRDPSRAAYVWASSDRGRERFASVLRAVPAPLADVELELERFPVPTIRVVGLDAWRAVLRDSRRFECVFVHRKYPYPSFRFALPSEDEPVIRIPRLPFGAYEVQVLDEGGVIDAASMAPHFFDRVDREHFYERDVPLKRLILGAPKLVRFRLEDAARAGARLEGVPAVVRLIPERSVLAISRRVSFDASGEAECWLPDMRDRPGTSGVELRAFARGYMPAEAQLSCKHDMPSEHVIAMRALPEDSPSSVPLEGVGPTWVSLRLDEETSSVVLPLAPGEAELLPPPGQGWRGFFVRRAAGRLVTSGMQGGRASFERTHEVELRMRSGSRVLPGTHVELCVVDGGEILGARPMRADAQGRLTLRLPAASYYVLAVHAVEGASLTPIVVKDGPARFEIALQAFANFHGRVRFADHEAASEATIALVSELRSLPLRVLERVLDIPSQAPRCDDAGRYRLKLPSFVPRWRVTFRKRLDERWYRATGVFATQRAHQAQVFVLDA